MKVEDNEIKKALYRQKPTATKLRSEQGCYEYRCEVQIQGTELWVEVNFRVPIADMGVIKFHNEMEAQLLIKWIFNKTVL